MSAGRHRFAIVLLPMALIGVIAACAERPAAPPAAPGSLPASPDAPSAADSGAERVASENAPPASDAGVGSRCADRCEGQPSSALVTELQLRAKLTHRCYDRALTKNPDLRGRINVAVNVAEDGAPCAVSLAQDEIGDAEFAACAIGMFTARPYPAPLGGCLVVNVPIGYVPKLRDGGAAWK